MTTFDLAKIRADFPILAQNVYDKPLVYLDNAATTQKPRQVLEAIEHYYSWDNSNIHRGVHALSQRATEAYENSRVKVQQFIHAQSEKEIIFTSGTTAAINLVAQSYGRQFLKAGDTILISEMEHHSNIVPWQMLREQLGIEIQVIPMNDRGELILDEFEHLLSKKCKLVAVTHVSNALGTINPIKYIIEKAHACGAVVLVDGAQAVAHLPVDVQDLGCDFYVFSGHKLFAPTGIGVLYARLPLLEAMPPYQGGGEMIKMVSFTKTIYHDVPHKFEAGTPNIEGVIALGAAIDYVNGIGLSAIAEYEHGLLEYATAALAQLSKIRFVGEAVNKTSIISFVYANVHAHDVGTILDQHGIAIRTGHHCAMPTLEHFGLAATARASLAFYNTQDEINALVNGLEQVAEVLG